MIVCSCNVLSDHAVRGCLSGPDCPRTPAQVYRCLGCSPQCGRCAVTIRKILRGAEAASADAGACASPCPACPQARIADALDAALEDALAEPIAHPPRIVAAA